MPVRGFGATIGAGQESAWGTAVARAVWVRAITAGLERRILREKLGHHGSYGQASTAYRHQFDRAEESGGPIEWFMSYNDGTQMLLRHMFGTVADAGSTGAYTHTYTLAVPPPVGLTIEQIKGTDAALDTAQVFEGCRFNSWQIIAEAGRPVICTGDLLAETAGSITTAGSPTYSSNGLPVLHNHMGTGVTFDSVTLNARRLVLSVNRNLSRNQQLGSLLTAEPVDGRLDISLEVEVLWNAAKPYGAHYTGTQADATWTFTSGSLSAAFTLHNAVINEVSAPTQDAGGIVQTYRFEGFADATDQGLALVVTNANQLYTAN